MDDGTLVDCSPANAKRPEIKIRDRVRYILDYCHDKRVLHVGCAAAPYTQSELEDGTLLYESVERVASVQYGIDCSAEGIQILKAVGYTNLATANVERIGLDKPFGEVDFDLVLAGEVLEHLSNPGLFLDSVKSFLTTPSARLVLTAPNAYCAYRFVYSFLTRREAVDTDHVCYFSRSTLLQLLSKHGYDVEDFSFYSAREYEKVLNHGRFKLFWWIDRLATWFHPVLAEGVMMTCKLRDVQ